MLRLIIVDDESLTRKLLEDIIDWNSLDIEIVSTFPDGKSALNFIEKNKCDIVLTDIKMPHMSGLELAKCLHERFPGVYVVIISAYRDFEYARESIKYNVYDYILKPITQAGFYDVFSKLSVHLNDKIATTKLSEENNSDLSLVLSYVREFLSTVNSENSEQIKTKVEDLFSRFNKVSTLAKLANCLYSELCSIYGQDTVYASAPEVKKLNNIMDISALKEIIDDLIKLALELQSSGNTSKQNFSPAAIELATQYIEEHCHEQITRDDVARHIAFSPQYFSRYFHKYTNETFSDYLKHVRIRKAKHLLKNTNLRIKEISSMVGFRKERYFSALFKQFTNLSPQEYRSSATCHDDTL